MTFIKGKYFNCEVFKFNEFLNKLFDRSGSLFDEKFFESLVNTVYFKEGLIYLNIENQLEK